MKTKEFDKRYTDCIIKIKTPLKLRQFLEEAKSHGYKRPEYLDQNALNESNLAELGFMLMPTLRKIIITHLTPSKTKQRIVEYSDIDAIKEIATLVDDYGPFTMALAILLIDRFGPFDDFYLAKRVAMHFDTLSSAERVIYEVDQAVVNSVEIFLEYLTEKSALESELEEDPEYEY